MNKLWIIIKREYLTRVKKRSFLLTTLLAPLLILGFYAMLIFLVSSGASGASSKKTIAIVDESGLFKNELRDSKSIYFKFPSGDLDEVKADIEEKGYTGVIHVPEFNLYNVNDNIKFYSDERLGLGSKDFITDQLKARIKDLRMEEKGLDKEILATLNVNMDMKEISLDDEQTEETAGEILSLIGVVMGFALYFILIFFGMMVMRGVKEEKVNRIVEVIISSVKPFQLMLGKILGISLVGVTQFLIWGIIMYVGYLFLFPVMLSKLSLTPEMMSGAGGVQPSDLPSDLDGGSKMMLSLLTYKGYGKLAISFLFYFLGGYMIYASLFSAVGAAVEDESEAQQLVMPVMMPIIISVAILTTVLNDPHNTKTIWKWLRY